MGWTLAHDLDECVAPARAWCASVSRAGCRVVLGFGS
jgi:hypothetical protein